MYSSLLPVHIPRFTLLHGCLSLLALTACYLGFESNQYRHRLCAHVQQAVRLTLVTLLAQQTLEEDVQQEFEDAQYQEAWRAAAMYHAHRAAYDTHWAHVLHNTSLALQAQATYVSTTVVPAVHEAFSRAAASPPETTTTSRHWCHGALLRTVCHVVSGTASLADDDTKNNVMMEQHWTMLHRNKHQRETETWVLHVLANQTTQYRESAHAVDDFVELLQQQAATEQALAERDWQQVQAFQREQALLHNETVQLQHDMQTNTVTRDSVWKQAQHEGRVAYGMGIVSLCLACVGVVALWCLLCSAMVEAATARTTWPQHHHDASSDPYAILRRCLIAWFVTGVVNELSKTTPPGGSTTSRLYLGLASHDGTQKPVEWIIGLAVAIGVTQAILLHDFSSSTTIPPGRHVRNLLWDGAKLSAVSILHVLTVWLVGAGLVPGNVATLLLNTTTQIVLVGVYVLVLVWEPPVFSTGETTTVLTSTEDSSSFLNNESTPLQGHAQQHRPKYLNQDASPAVIYLGGSSSSSSSDTSTSGAGASYTTAADAGFVASWNVWLLVCLIRDIGMVAPCVQLHPLTSGFVLGMCGVASLVVACHWWRSCCCCCAHEDGGLPRTIVV